MKRHRGMSWRSTALTAARIALLGMSAIGVVVAASPPTSGSYTATPGTISDGCPADAVSCGTTSSGDGYFVRAITSGDTSYYQTIIVPSDSTSTTGVPASSSSQCYYSASGSMSVVLSGSVIDSKDAVTPAFFDVDSLAGQNLIGDAPDPTGSGCTSSVQFQFPTLTDLPSLVADANEYAEVKYKVIDGVSGAQAYVDSPIKVIPSMSFGLDQIVVEGGTATIKVYVSGNPSGPIVVPYTIGGSATPGVDHGAADGTLTISSADPSSSEISFPVYQDNVADAGETVTITLGQPSNAILGDKVTTTVTISEKNRFITAGLKALIDSGYAGSGFSHLYFTSDCCAAVSPTEIIADARANFSAGQLSYDWSGTDAALLALSDIKDNILSFYPDPQSLPAGVYTVRVKVSSQDNPEVVAEAELPIKVVTGFDTSQWIPGNDSDSDGVLDGPETFMFDQNENGIMNYLDAFHAANVLQMHPQPVNAGLTTLDRTLADGTEVSMEWHGFINAANADAKQAMVSDIGTALRLGRTALALDSKGASVPMEEFKQAAAVAYPDQANLLAMDKLYGDSIEDVEITQLTIPGQSVQVVMPRANPPSGDSVIWAFNPVEGWGRFRLDGHNAIDSTAGFKVEDKLYSCPDVHVSGYVSGAAAECVRLTVEDGGPNDADGAKNGVVKLLIGEGPEIAAPVSSADSTSNTTSANSADVTGKGGGGVLGVYSLILLVLAAYDPKPSRSRPNGR